MTEKQTKPAIRYAEFTDAWEQREFATLVSRKSILCSESNLPRVEYEDVVSGLGQLNKDVNDKVCNKTGFLFESNDILFGKLRPYLCNWLLSSFKGIAVGDWWVLHPNETCPAFIYALIQSDKFKNISNVSTGTKMPRSDWSIVSKTIFKIPPDLTEQSIIGDIFCNLDNLITLHQREYDKVLSIKKAMLEKMFPKNGEDKPEIRFAGFTDAWEQRKLGDIAEIVGGGTPSTTVDAYWNGDIDWYAPAEIGEQIYLESSQKKITQSGLENSSAKVLPVGTILFTSRAGIGKTAILTMPGSTNQGFQSIIPHVGVLDTYFIYSRTPELKSFGERIGAGSTFVEVSGKQMAKMKILIPTVAEQVIIGTHFKHLDNLITLHQRELRKLQNIKKALLEKMFVPG